MNLWVYRNSHPLGIASNFLRRVLLSDRELLQLDLFQLTAHASRQLVGPWTHVPDAMTCGSG